MVAQVEFEAGEAFVGGEALLVEVGAGGFDEGAGDVGECLAAPQAEGDPEDTGGFVGPVGGGFAAGGQVPGELGDVEFVLGHLDDVAGGVGGDGVGRAGFAEGPADGGDGGVYLGPGGRRWGAVPDRVDDGLHRYELVGA